MSIRHEIRSKSDLVRDNRGERKWLRWSGIVFAIAGLSCVAAAPAKAGDIPRFDRNALFINQMGAPVYFVADLQPSNFLGVPAVVGVFTDGGQPIAFAAVPSNNPAVWLWLTAGGPAGIIQYHAGPQPYVTWQDNRGNSGLIITF